MLFPVQEMWLLHFWVSPSPIADAVTEQPDQLTLISSFMTSNHLNSFRQLSHIRERQLIIASSWFSWKSRSRVVYPFLVALVRFSGRPGRCPDLVWSLILCVSLANLWGPVVWLNTILVMLLWSCYLDVCVCTLSRVNHVQLFATLWTVAPLSMGFSRQEYESGLSCPPPGDLPNPGRDRTHTSCNSCNAGGFFITEPPVKPPLRCD